jgi:hypothetical protein
MEITPPNRTRPAQLDVSEIARHWIDWGWSENQHHCILVAFFESWMRTSRIEEGHYRCLAIVLDEHYRQAVFPADAKQNPFVYWLAGPSRGKKFSYIASREEFDERYLAQFGPLFDVVEWLKAFRTDPDRAVESLQKRRAAEAAKVNTKAPDLNPHGTNQHTGIGDTKTVTKSSDNNATYAHARLRRDRPDIHARVLAGEISAHAGMVEARFRKLRKPRKLSNLDKIRRLIAKLDLSPEERAILKRELWTEELDQLLTIACRLSASERLAAIEYLTHLIRLDIGADAALQQINCVVHDTLHGNEPTPTLAKLLKRAPC